MSGARDPRLSRRDLLVLGGLAAGAGLSACREAEAFSCAGATGLSAKEVALRDTLGYVDRAAEPEKACDRCAQWEPPASRGSCGGCKIMKGPIHPKGTCNVYVAAG